MVYCLFVFVVVVFGFLCNVILLQYIWYVKKIKQTQTDQ